MQLNQLQRIWDGLARRVWHNGSLQSFSSLSSLPPVVISTAQVLSARELALWGSLARLLLGLLMLITGVTGEQSPTLSLGKNHPFNTTARGPVRLQQKNDWCQFRAACS